MSRKTHRKSNKQGHRQTSQTITWPFSQSTQNNKRERNISYYCYLYEPEFGKYSHRCLCNAVCECVRITQNWSSKYWTSCIMMLFGCDDENCDGFHCKFVVSTWFWCDACEIDPKQMFLTGLNIESLNHSTPIPLYNTITYIYTLSSITAPIYPLWFGGALLINVKALSNNLHIRKPFHSKIIFFRFMFYWFLLWFCFFSFSSSLSLSLFFFRSLSLFPR